MNIFFCVSGASPEKAGIPAYVGGGAIFFWVPLWKGPKFQLLLGKPREWFNILHKVSWVFETLVWFLSSLQQPSEWMNEWRFIIPKLLEEREWEVVEQMRQRE